MVVALLVLQVQAVLVAGQATLEQMGLATRWLLVGHLTFKVRRRAKGLVAAVAMEVAETATVTVPNMVAAVVAAVTPHLLLMQVVALSSVQVLVAEATITIVQVAAGEVRGGSTP